MKKKNKKDTISQIKNDKEKIKKEEENEKSESYSNKSEDEEELKTGIVKEQTVINKNEPKNLKELFDLEPQTKEKKETNKKINNKPKNKNEKLHFINSKYSGNANSKYDNEMKKKIEGQK